MSNEPAGRTRLHILVLAAVVAVQVVPSLFTRDLWPPDEPRYAEVAREMVASGDYILPHLNGEVYSQKPPMFFWSAAALQHAGLGLAATRVVTGLAVFALVCTVYLLCRPLLGARLALLAALIGLTTGQLVMYARRGTLDPLLALFTTAALAFGFAALHRREGRAIALWVGCYASMALATLTKGPVGMLVPGLVLLVYGIADRRSVRPGGWAHLTGVAVYAALLLSWLVPAMVAGGAYYRESILVYQNVGRAVRSWSHAQPFYYYLMGWPRYLAPWTPVLLLACIAVAVRWRRAGPVPRLGLVWLIVPLVFFSLVSGKRMGYLLPAVPAAGLVCAWYLSLDREKKGRFLTFEKWLFGLSFLTVIGFAAALAAVVLWPRLITKDYAGTSYPATVRSFLSPATTAAALACLAVPFGAAVYGLARPGAAGTKKAALLVAAVLLMGPPVDLFVTPLRNPTESDRPFGMRLRELVDGQPVLLYGSSFAGRFNIWTGRLDMPVIRTEADLRDALARPGTFVVGEKADLLDALTPEGLDYYAVARARLDDDRICLIEGRAPAAGQTKDSGAAEDAR